MKKAAQILNNNSGQITIEFMFSFALAFGVFMIIFAMMFTLTVTELTQYVVFAAARAHSAGNVDTEAQQTAARNKYKELITGPTLSPLFTNGWFKVSEPQELDIRSGPDSTFSQDLAGGNDVREVFMGVSTRFQAMVLNIKIPLVGGGSEEEGEEGFQTRVNAILIREPSQRDCADFMDARREAIARIRASAAPYYKADAYIPLEDNGC